VNGVPECRFNLNEKKLTRHPVRRDKSAEDWSGGRPGCKSSIW
jgi:hypothetical protein